MEGAEAAAAPKLLEPIPDRTFWAATTSWRGDLRLFGRIVQKAVDLIEPTGLSTPCSIEFAIRDDLERYLSLSELFALVPNSTLRSFEAARIQVGSDPLSVEVCFGRRRRLVESIPCPRGVSVEVRSDGSVEEESLKAIRESVTTVVERGGFAWAQRPQRGTSGSRPTLVEALKERRSYRLRVTQLGYATVSLALFGAALLAYRLIEATDSGIDLPSIPDPIVFAGAVLAIAQFLSIPLSPLIFPAIDIADLTPGRRLLRGVGRSGVLTATVGVVVKAIVG
jgi:hypothetical protein